MKIKEQGTHILKLCAEREEAETDVCEWSVFYFDLDAYGLSIESDYGSFIHRWTATPNTESFLKLMSRIDTEQLLSEISDTEFNFPDSVNATIRNIEASDYLNDDDKKALLTEFKEYGYGHLNSIVRVTEDDFLAACERIFSDYDVDYTERVYSYPLNAQRVANTFERNIQPYIKDMLKERERNKKADYDNLQQR